MFSIVALFFWVFWYFVYCKVYEESEDEDEEDGLTEEQFKKSEIYKLLVGDLGKKFGGSVPWRLVVNVLQNML